MNSQAFLVEQCRVASLDTFAARYNRLVREFPELATALPSNSFARNVLANRLAAGDTRWLQANNLARWEPACVSWLVGSASSRVGLESLIPLVERVAEEFPRSSWDSSIPGHLALLQTGPLTDLIAGLLKLSSTNPDDPGVVEVLTALHLLVGWRDGAHIEYAPALQIAESPRCDPEELLTSYRWSAPKNHMDWQLLKVAVLGPDELRLEAADLWADQWEWRNGLLLGLNLMPQGLRLQKSRCFHHRHSGRAVAWAYRLSEVNWFDEEVSPCFLLELEAGPSPMVESLIHHCRTQGLMPELTTIAEEWLSPVAQERFEALL